MSTQADLPASCARKFRPGQSIRWQRGRQATAQATWQCLAADEPAALDAIAGTITSVGAGSPVLRVLGLTHPEYPFLVAEGANSHHYGWDKTLGRWKYCEITVDFATPDYSLTGQNAFMTVNSRPGGRALRGKASQWEFGNGTTPEVDPGTMVPGRIYEVQVHQVPWIDEDLYNSLEGRTNLNAFRGLPPGHVLCESVCWTRTALFNGTESYQLAIYLHTSWIDWNAEYMADGSLDRLYRTGFAGDDTQMRMPPADLDLLFSPYAS